MIDLKSLELAEEQAKNAGHEVELETIINFMPEPARTELLEFLDDYEKIEDVVMWCLYNIKGFNRSQEFKGPLVARLMRASYSSVDDELDAVYQTRLVKDEHHARSIVKTLFGEV